MDDERRNRHILSREEIEQMEKATEEERQKRLAPYKALRRKMLLRAQLTERAACIIRRIHLKQTFR